MYFQSIEQYTDGFSSRPATLQTAPVPTGQVLADRVTAAQCVLYVCGGGGRGRRAKAWYNLFHYWLNRQRVITRPGALEQCTQEAKISFMPTRVRRKTQKKTKQKQTRLAQFAAATRPHLDLETRDPCPGHDVSFQIGWNNNIKKTRKICTDWKSACVPFFSWTRRWSFSQLGVESNGEFEKKGYGGILVMSRSQRWIKFSIDPRHWDIRIFFNP